MHSACVHIAGLADLKLGSRTPGRKTGIGWTLLKWALNHQYATNLQVLTSVSRSTRPACRPSMARSKRCRIGSVFEAAAASSMSGSCVAILFIFAITSVILFSASLRRLLTYTSQEQADICICAPMWHVRGGCPAQRGASTHHLLLQSLFLVIKVSADLLQSLCRET